jgi:hypothetical protein
MGKKNKSQTSKLEKNHNSYKEKNINQKRTETNSINIESREKSEINSDSLKKNEKSEEIQEESAEFEDEEEDEKNETKIFIIELLILSKVMDNREEIKNCICHNYISLDEDKDIQDLNDNENSFVEKEVIPSVEIPIFRIPKNKRLFSQLNNIESEDQFYVKMNDLTKSLQKLGFPVCGSMINIFINYANNYIFFGTEPFDNKALLYSYMLEPNKDIIKIKMINYIQKRMLDGYTNSIINTYFRKPIFKVLDSLEIKEKLFAPSNTNIDYYAEGSDDESISSLSLLSYDNGDENYNSLLNKNNLQKKISKFEKMSEAQKRERKIGYVIEKVFAWRRFYNGLKDENDNYIKYSLDKAAEKVAVSKKSLDDYLLQIRLGRKYGFDFNNNKYKKIGVLRDYVKKIKKINQLNNKKRARKKKVPKNKINNNIKKENDEKEQKIIKANNSLFEGIFTNNN